MATNYSNYPAYRSAFEKAQRLYFELYGATGSRAGGLAADMDRIASTKGESSPEYKKVKAAFDAKQREYDSAVTERDGIRKQIDNKTAKDAAAKDADKKKKTDAATVTQLESQRDSLRRQNKTEEADAVQVKIDAIKNPKTEAEAAVTGDAPTGGTFDGYTVTNGKVTNQKGYSVYLVDSGTGANTAPQFYNSVAEAREAFLKKYAQPGQLDKLKQQLLAANYIKQSDLATGNWVNGLDDMITARTLKVVTDVKYGGGNTVSETDFLTMKKSAGSGETSIRRDLSTRGDARTLLNMYMNDLAGAEATEEEHDAFYKELHSAEMKETSYTKDGSTVGSVMTDAERLLIAAKVAKKKLRNTEVDTLLNSANGSRAAVDVAELQRTAAEYGLTMTASEALRYVADGIGQANYLDKQKERLRLLSIKMNPNLADHINAGGTVKEVYDVYANIKSRKLGVVVKDSHLDRDVVDAANNGISAAQFEKQLQANPEWRFTEEAREIGADFINTIGKMWGRG